MSTQEKIRTDQEIIEDIKNLLHYHEQQVAKYTNWLTNLGVLTSANAIAAHASPIIKEQQLQITPKSTLPAATNIANPQVRLFNGKQTTESVVLNILSDGVPRTTRQIRDRFNDLMGVELTIEDFSSRLSSMIGKKQPRVKRHTFPDNPTHNKYYFGVAEWFDGENLKSEYLNRLNQ